MSAQVNGQTEIVPGNVQAIQRSYSLAEPLYRVLTSVSSLVSRQKVHHIRRESDRLRV